MQSPLEFGCHLNSHGEDIDTCIREAKTIEQSGFDVLSLPDHLFSDGQPDWEVWTMLGVLAAETEEIDLMPGVADSVRRHPTHVAHATATLDQATHGRARIGMGAGEAFNFRGVEDFDWSKPFTRFKEHVEVMLQLWDSAEADPVSYDGEYFQLDDAYLGFQSVQEPHPPLIHGGYGPKMRRFLGEVADGWLPWIHTPDAYAEDLELIFESAEASGRDPSDIRCSLMIPSAISEDRPDEVEQELVEQRASNLVLRPPLLDSLGYPDLAEEAPIMWQMDHGEEKTAAIEDIVEQVAYEDILEIFVAGTPESGIEQIERFVDAGVDEVVIIPEGDLSETIEHYRETIIPYFS